jgi:transposase
MNNLLKYLIGVDVSKDKFDACLISLDSNLGMHVQSTHKFENTPAGFKEMTVWMKKHYKEKIPLEILMEATGVYHERLAIYLTDQEMKVFVVLPNKSQKYLQSLGLKSKNDKIDAKGLAIMCAHGQFKQWKPIAKYFYELRLLTRHYQSIQETKTGFTNQLHALKHSGYPNKELIKQQEKTIAMFDKQLKEIKKLIEKHIASDENVQRKVNYICQIKGLSLLSVATVIAETNGFELIKSNSQLVSYAGYDVVENQSGKHIGKTKISKKGNSRIRRILHMPALITVKYKEPTMQNLYERVFDRTKLKMKGYVAVQRKLLELIYTLWKKDEAYNPEFKLIVPPKGSTTLDKQELNKQLRPSL